MRVRALVTLTAIAGLSPGVAICDEAFRCGSWLVTSDLSVAELLKKCGEPTSREVSTEDVFARTTGGATQRVGVTVTEVWRYDRGTRAAAMVVTIVDGKIQSLERATAPARNGSE
jgi:hypothetical protein